MAERRGRFTPEYRGTTRAVPQKLGFVQDMARRTGAIGLTGQETSMPLGALTARRRVGVIGFRAIRTASISSVLGEGSRKEDTTMHD